MGYSAKAVANYFLDLAEAEGKQLTPLKLQKLVYIAHGWYMAICDGTKLVDDEFAEAWQYGPVFPSLYHEFKRFGRRGIKNHAIDIIFHDDEPHKSDDKFEFNIEEYEPKIKKTDKKTKEILNAVWANYGKFSGLQLSDMTHRPGTPWDIVRKAVGNVKNADIDNNLIREHYEQLALANRDDGP